MINVLFVAFEFPPLGGAGVQRSIKFVKYLSEFDIRPIVITVREDNYPQIMSGQELDYSLLLDLPKNIVIERIHCKDYSKRDKPKFQKWITKFFSVVENFNKSWKEGVTEQLPELIKKYEPKAIYVSIPPFAMAPLWKTFSQKYNIPLIIDFRDAWSQWCLSPNATIFHYWRKLALEKQVLNTARAIVCSSNQIMKDLQKVHPTVPFSKYNVIRNGFDLCKSFPNNLKIDNKNKIIIGYVGSFYYTPEAKENIFKPWWKRPVHRMLNYVPRKEDWLYRSPYFFLKSIRCLLKRNKTLENKIEIRFAGKTPNWLIHQIKEFGLEDICKHYGYLIHDDVLKFQHDCDALLITSSKVLGGKDYSIAGKTYEYFTIGKPILGFVCESEQKDILLESGMAFIFDPDNTNENSLQLEEIFKDEIALFPDWNKIMQYHRKQLTFRLSELIKIVSSK